MYFVLAGDNRKRPRMLAEDASNYDLAREQATTAGMHLISSAQAMLCILLFHESLGQCYHMHRQRSRTVASQSESTRLLLGMVPAQSAPKQLTYSPMHPCKFLSAPEHALARAAWRVWPPLRLQPCWCLAALALRKPGPPYYLAPFLSSWSQNLCPWGQNFPILCPDTSTPHVTPLTLPVRPLPSRHCPPTWASLKPPLATLVATSIPRPGNPMRPTLCISCRSRCICALGWMPPALPALSLSSALLLLLLLLLRRLLLGCCPCHWPSGLCCGPRGGGLTASQGSSSCCERQTPAFLWLEASSRMGEQASPKSLEASHAQQTDLAAATLPLIWARSREAGQRGACLRG